MITEGNRRGLQKTQYVIQYKSKRVCRRIITDYASSTSFSESMRKDPDKYNALIFCDNTSSSSTRQTTGYSHYYDTVPDGQQQQYPSQDYISMLLEESEKLYDKVSKELVDESISDYAFRKSTSSPYTKNL